MKLSNIAFLYTFIKLHNLKFYNTTLIKPQNNFFNYLNDKKIILY